MEFKHALVICHEPVLARLLVPKDVYVRAPIAFNIDRDGLIEFIPVDSERARTVGAVLAMAARASDRPSIVLSSSLALVKLRNCVLEVANLAQVCVTDV